MRYNILSYSNCLQYFRIPFQGHVEKIQHRYNYIFMNGESVDLHQRRKKIFLPVDIRKNSEDASKIIGDAI